MAVSLLRHEVSDLCLGKPGLRALSISSTVADALSALKSSGDSFISLWSCNHGKNNDENGNHLLCKCVGRICMVNVICYLCKDENLLSPNKALKAHFSLILPNSTSVVTHLEPSSTLLEAINLMIKGAQNLVVPIKTSKFSLRRKQNQNKLSPTSSTIHSGREFCWLTQEDVIRFILGSIGLFSPIPALSIDTLGLIRSEINVINYDFPATLAIEAISSSLIDQTCEDTFTDHLQSDQIERPLQLHHTDDSNHSSRRVQTNAPSQTTFAHIVSGRCSSLLGRSQSPSPPATLFRRFLLRSAATPSPL